MEDVVNHIIELMIAVFSPIITNAICDWWETQKKKAKEKALQAKGKELKGQVVKPKG